MNNLQWLLNGDPVIVHLVNRHLLNQNCHATNKGFIQRYLKLFDTQTLKWGDGFYGPKWISTNYTLLDLKYMEILPKTPEYQISLINYFNHYWSKYIDKFGILTLDLCIAGMFISLLSYGKIIDNRINQLIDYILDYSMCDGGWNCLWNHQRNPHISSVHTTINVLEGLVEYINQNYEYRRSEVKTAIECAINTLLSRQLIYKKNTSTLIHTDMANHHFPYRWKYDYLRILELLAKQKFAHCLEMKSALDLLENKLKRGKLTKGSTISGLIHFPLETETYGRFNTLRAYIVLKFYRPNLYDQLINEEY
jgi:hypothetical protein